MLMMKGTRRLFKLLLVSTLTYAIKGQCDGSHFIIKDAIKLRELSSCIHLAGALTIAPEFKGNVSLPSLVKMMGEIVISGNGITEIDLHQLDEVHKLSVIDVPKLEQLHIVELKKFETLILKNTGSITFLSFNNKFNFADEIEISDSKINSIVGMDAYKIQSLKLTSLPDLQRISILSLNNVVKMEINNLSKLETVSLPALVFIKEEGLFINSSKAKISMPNLNRAHSKLFYEGIKEIFTPNLEHVNYLQYKDTESIDITLDKLETINQAIFIDNNQMKSISLPKLNHTNSISVQANQKLTKLSLPYLIKFNEIIVREPTLTKFQLNATMKGKRVLVVASVDCKLFDKLSFVPTCNDFRSNPTIDIEFPTTEDKPVTETTVDYDETEDSIEMEPTNNTTDNQSEVSSNQSPNNDPTLNDNNQNDVYVQTNTNNNIDKEPSKSTSHTLVTSPIKLFSMILMVINLIT